MVGRGRRECARAIVACVRRFDVPQFLIVYNQLTGDVDVTPFGDDERDTARERRFALEREHRLDPHIEVVLVSARSEDVVRQTHARYFKSVRELVESALDG